MNNEVVELLYRRGFGGADAAVVPSINPLPAEYEASPPAGVHSIKALVGARLTGSQPAKPTWVFMLGGPGNGKSHQLADLLGKLGVSDRPRSSLATRSLPPVSTAYGTLLAINDATIRPVPSPPGGHLLADLSQAMGAEHALPTFLWVNINRGVLIEERPLAQSAEAGAMLVEVIDWLLGSVENLQTVKPEDHSTLPPWTRRADFRGVDLIAVSLDTVSLFEPTPDEALTWGDLPVMSLDAERRTSPAGELLSRLVADAKFDGGACVSCVASSICPFRANAQSLDGPVGQGLLRISRATELGTGQIFTFRDVWAIFATAILGRPQEFSGAASPCEWTREQVRVLGERKSKVRAISALALQRLQFALFETEVRGSFKIGEATIRMKGPDMPAPVKRLAVVDPLQCAGQPWTVPVSEALMGIPLAQSPSARLTDAVSGMRESLHFIDHEFEKVLLGSVMEDERTIESASQLLGSGLYRLTALAGGNHAYRGELQSMVDLWNSARINGNSQVALARAITRLILGSNAVIRLPAVANRVDPELVAPGTLVALIDLHGMSAPSVRFDVSGSQVTAILQIGRQRTIRIPIDLRLAREATARALGGFTEASGTISPRLERSRAALLSASFTPAPLELDQPEAVLR